MSDFYIRQSLHFTSIVDLAAERGISPGFIAWVNGRRFVATPITDRLEYPVDDVFVIAGQDNIKWIDETTGGSDLEGTFPNPTVAGIKNLQVVFDVEQPLPHGDIVKSITRACNYGSPTSLQENPGFVTIRKSDIIVVTPGMPNKFFTPTVTGVDVTVENLTLIDGKALSGGVASYNEWVYLLGYITTGAYRNYYIWQIDITTFTQLNVVNLTTTYGLEEVLAFDAVNFVGYSPLLVAALVGLDATGYIVSTINLDGTLDLLQSVYLTPAFTPDPVMFVDVTGFYTCGTETGELSTNLKLIGTVPTYPSPVVTEVDLGVPGTAIGIYIDNATNNAVVISRKLDGYTRITTISMDVSTVTHYDLNVYQPKDFCLPFYDLSGTYIGQIPRSLTSIALLSGGPAYKANIIPAIPDGLPTPIATVNIPNSTNVANVICARYINTNTPVPNPVYIFTYADINQAGTFNIQTHVLNNTIYNLDGYDEVMVPNIDMGKESPANYPATVKVGDILTAMPGSSGIVKLVYISDTLFLTIRKSSIVITSINARDPSVFTSTPIDLIGTPDLSLVSALNGTYDGSRYAWVAGSYNNSVWYIWKIDVTNKRFIACYPLPSNITSVQSIAYANNYVLASVYDGYYKAVKFNPSNGTVVDSTLFPINPVGSQILIPNINTSTNTNDFAWFGCNSSIDGYGNVVRFTPASLVHKSNDTINYISVPDGYDLTSVQLLLNTLKLRFNAHIGQLGIHILNETDSDYIVNTANATDSETPIHYTSEAAAANDLKAKINGHLTQPGVHVIDDTTNTITVPDVTDDTDLNSIITLVNAIGHAVGASLDGYYNHHLIQSGVHVTNDYLNVTYISAATDLNSLKASLLDYTYLYEMHRSSIVHHIIPDGYNIINVISDWSLGQLYTSTILANDLKEKFNQHLYHDGLHYYFNTEDAIVVPNANVSSYNDLSSIITLTNTLKASFNNHLSKEKRLIHQTITNSSIAGVNTNLSTSVNSFGDGQLILNDIKDKFNRHVSQPGVHLQNSTSTVTAANANDTTPTWPTAAQLAIELATNYNNHILNSNDNYHYETDDSLRISTTDISNVTEYDLQTIINITNTLGYNIGCGAYNQHIINRDFDRVPLGVGNNVVNGGLIIDNDNSLYVAEASNNLVRKFNMDARTFVDIDLSPNSPSSLVHSMGYIYAAGTNYSLYTGRIDRINSDDNSVVNITTSLPYFPQSIAYSSDGYVYTVHQTPSNSICRTSIITGLVESVTTLVELPTHIINGNDGYMWVGQNNITNPLIRIKAEDFALYDTISLAFAVNFLIDSGTYMWAIGSTSIARISKYNNDVVNFPTNPDLSVPSGASYDGYKYIYISYNSGSKIVSIDTTLSSTQTIKTISSGKYNLPASLYSTGTSTFDGYTGVYQKLELHVPVVGNCYYVGQILNNREFKVISLHKEIDTTNYSDYPNDISNIISDVTLSNVILRLNDLKVKFNSHISSTTYHYVADTNNTITAADASDTAPTYPTAYNLVLDLRSKINTHLIEPNVHYNNDTVSTLVNVTDGYFARIQAPIPNNNTCLTEILALTRAIGCSGYISTNLAVNSGSVNGSYNNHLLQPSTFIDTTIPVVGPSIELINTDLYENYYIGVIVLSQDIDGIPYFSTLHSQLLSLPSNDNNPSIISGTILNSFNFVNLENRYEYPKALFSTISNFVPNVWFLSGGTPDEISNPYRLNFIPEITDPVSPFVQTTNVPDTIYFEQNKLPVDIISGGFSGLHIGGEGATFDFEVVRIAYAGDDYIGDYFVNFNELSGSLDYNQKYPMGGALKFINIHEVIGKTTWYYQFDTQFTLASTSWVNLGDGYVSVEKSSDSDVWVCNLNLDLVDVIGSGGSIRISYSLDNGETKTALPSGTAVRNGIFPNIATEVNIQAVLTGINAANLKFYIEGSQISNEGNMYINRLCFIVRKS